LTASEVCVVAAWHEALNDGDVEGVAELSHPDVEVGGPRGSGRGAQLLRDWVLKASIHLEPRRIFHQGATVIVEQEAVWRSPDTGETTDRQTVASIFVVLDGLVTRVSRHPDLADALRAADLGGSRELREAYQTGARGPGSVEGETL
jgi:ketosteroid isomerase-like protein